MREESFVVYLKIDRHSEVKNPDVYLSDVGAVYCKDEVVKAAVEHTFLLQFDTDGSNTQALSIMAVVQAIDDGCPWPVLIHNLGESEFIISLAPKKKPPKWLTLSKAAFVMAVTFVGSVFAIMTYNEDVSVTGVFDKIYRVMMGTERSGPGVLEWSYAFGIAFGIIIFFNHFGKHKLTKDPTPMEIEMEKYEADIGDTILKEASRKGDMIDLP